MIELHDFYNDGRGWVCRQCEHELTPKNKPTHTHSRMFREGEAESKGPQLASLALAKWLDAERRTLICPRCGVTELVDIS
ncbi:MAG: hypothetical protein WBO68_00540 [Pyrinomonadaceae bacterium]